MQFFLLLLLFLLHALLKFFLCYLLLLLIKLLIALMKLLFFGLLFWCISNGIHTKNTIYVKKLFDFTPKISQRSLDQFFTKCTQLTIWTWLSPLSRTLLHRLTSGFLGWIGCTCGLSCLLRHLLLLHGVLHGRFIKMFVTEITKALIKTSTWTRT
ncbi:MAG: hypothetical protein COU65_04555 [Candidatus Pacebacteria bacterium CG10_big_fil_rev_8_21_14_0_10_42_12]|nr:MAG: hypothetical protein COU65_04555 [Candidatus Pacebacteria bacterium CG10_big_fil_rev_8_21_14_0_10_42_12]